jgi:hypothetical protein
VVISTPGVGVSCCASLCPQSGEHRRTCGHCS